LQQAVNQSAHQLHFILALYTQQKGRIVLLTSKRICTCGRMDHASCAADPKSPLRMTWQDATHRYEAPFIFMQLGDDYAHVLHPALQACFKLPDIK
jgi:hypothetical protein